MAHSKQAKKRIRQNEVRRVHNKDISSRMRSSVRAVLAAVEQGDLEAAKAGLPIAVRQVDKAAKTNIIHDNCAARKKSMIERAINRAQA